MVVALLVTVAVHVPAIAGSPKVALRMQMWLDPWTNAQPNGDQGALARWAIAAGFIHGQGLGYAPAWALPAGHTDLVIAHLAEELGAIGLLIYLVLRGGDRRAGADGGRASTARPNASSPRSASRPCWWPNGS